MHAITRPEKPQSTTESTTYKTREATEHNREHNLKSFLFENQKYKQPVKKQRLTSGN
jgi:hypothetical protein